MIRKYPSFFDKHYWLAELKTLTSSDLDKTKNVIQGLLTTKENSLSVAARRVNDSQLRDRPDDAVIDALIGLETILTDDELGEMTHKLALRAGALLNLLPDKTKNSQEIFREVKLINKYRSKVVHGKQKEVEKIDQKSFGGDKWGTVKTALNYLRQTILAVIRYPEYLEPSIIDTKLLLGGGTKTVPDEDKV